MPYVPFGDNDKFFTWEKTKKQRYGKKHLILQICEIKTKYNYCFVSLSNNTGQFFFCTVCHAAVNAIASRTIPDLTGCTMYTTLHPDEDCAHIIAQSGIKEVKCMKNNKRGHRPFEDKARTILLLRQVSIKYVHITLCII